MKKWITFASAGLLAVTAFAAVDSKSTASSNSTGSASSSTTSASSKSSSSTTGSSSASSSSKPEVVSTTTTTTGANPAIVQAATSETAKHPYSADNSVSNLSFSGQGSDSMSGASGSATPAYTAAQAKATGSSGPQAATASTDNSVPTADTALIAAGVATGGEGTPNSVGPKVNTSDVFKLPTNPPTPPSVIKLIKLYPNLVKNITPYGSVCVEGQTCDAPTASASSSGSSAGAPRSGEAVFGEVCTNCHSTGLLGSPKFGDKGMWAPRIAKGKDTLYQHALNGFNQMPARGGGELSDQEVKNAVDYMVSKAS